MQHKIQLAIPKPCHENWKEMTKQQQGRFCNACATTVVDFTNMSDGELLNFFTNKRSGDYCGRILPHQLERNITGVVYRSIPFGYAILIFLILFFFSKPSHAKTQETISLDIYALPFKGTHSDFKNGTLFTGAETSKSRAVSGKIYSISGEPIIGAEIKQIKSKSTFTTKQNGSFVFLIEGDTKQIQITAPGFQTKLVPITSENYYEITLQPSKKVCAPQPEIMGKIVIRKPNN